MLLLRAGSQYWHNNRNIEDRKAANAVFLGETRLAAFLSFGVDLSSHFGASQFSRNSVSLSPLFAFRAIYLQLAPKSEMKQKNKI